MNCPWRLKSSVIKWELKFACEKFLKQSFYCHVGYCENNVLLFEEFSFYVPFFNLMINSTHSYIMRNIVEPHTGPNVQANTEENGVRSTTWWKCYKWCTIDWTGKEITCLYLHSLKSHCLNGFWLHIRRKPKKRALVIIRAALQ